MNPIALNYLMHMVYAKDDTYEQVQLTDTQREAITSCIAADGLRASVLARITNTTVQHSSTVLATLHKKGYLDRYPDPESQNGLSYVYTCDPERWGDDISL